MIVVTHPAREAVAITGIGAVTPLGGVAFLAGWACLAWAALRGR
jgi:uncharacterized membrane protein YgdD (TMEM256/DUF423 family)